MDGRARRVLLAMAVMLWASDGRASAHLGVTTAAPATDAARAAATMVTIRIVAVALESYSVDLSSYPPASTMAELRPVLVPTYVRELPTRDAWARELEVSSRIDGYEIRSLGSDGARDGWSPAGEVVDLGLDIVFADGEFVQWPRLPEEPEEERAEPPADCPPFRELPAALAELVVSDELSFDLANAAIDQGSRAVPALAHLLCASPDERVRERVAAALAVIGGRAAADVLSGQLERTPGAWLRAMLAIALPSADSWQGREALLAMLDDGAEATVLEPGVPAIAAALSLGLLRATEAEERLARLADATEPTATSFAAAAALRLMRSGGRVGLSGSATEDDRAIAAVLARGVPALGDGHCAFDPGRGREWRSTSFGWSFVPRDDGGGLPWIGLTVHRSPDGLRALVRVGAHGDPLLAFPLTFVLARGRSGWTPQAVLVLF